MIRRLGALLALTALLLGPAQPATAATTTGKALLGQLTVRAEAGAATYSRAKFTHWIDADRDGCDTREEVLIAESRVAATTTTGCRVTRGRWTSWYDGATWTRPADVDIDHVVALQEAWTSGARAWTDAQRKAYANDLGYAWTLDAVTDNVNASKGSRDPAEWLPARDQCKYARHWVAIKYRWRLTIDTAERAALAGILTGTCGALPLTAPSRGL